ncbi:MAG: flagellar motor protein MotB [Sneathiellaceae bacterium]
MQGDPIIVKKKKVVGHGGHHGGAWKVAYADFVTAMMAFFLLLWLLNVTTDEQRLGIADYFAPASTSQTTSGSGGVLGGTTIAPEGARISTSTGSPAVVLSIRPPEPTKGGKEGEDKDAPDDKNMGAKATEEQLQKELEEREQQAFQQAEEKLRQAIQDNPDLADLSRHLLIDNTPEGLRIQLVDQAQESMFAAGSAALSPKAKELIGLVAQAVGSLPNDLSISGHTDATPFRGGGGTYGNWELSSDRANATRRQLIADGIPAERVEEVRGRAAKEPLIANDPENASNRRISMVLLRDQEAHAAAAAASAASAASKEPPKPRGDVLPPRLQRQNGTGGDSQGTGTPQPGSRSGLPLRLPSN